jgi:hypothetical protein
MTETSRVAPAFPARVGGPERAALRKMRFLPNAVLMVAVAVLSSLATLVAQKHIQKSTVY